MSSTTELRREMIALPGGEEFVEAYVGWREWVMRADRGVVSLLPIVQGGSGGRRPAWKPGVNEAVCFCRKHAESPRCGFHAWASPPKAVFYRTHDRCWGEVALWGDVEIAEKGYRATHAMITGLWLLPDSPLLVPSAAREYDVPMINPGYVKVTLMDSGQPGSLTFSRLPRADVL